MASAAPRTNVDVGKVMGRGFEALKANFLPFFGLALLLAGIPGFLNSYFTAAPAASFDPTLFSTSNYWLTLTATLFASFLGTALLQGVLTRSTILQLGGRDPDLRGSAMLGLRLLLPIVGISICTALLIGFGFVLLIVPGIMIWCALVVSVPALVEERRGVFDSIGRSRALTRGSRLQIFLLGVLFWVFAFIIGAIVTTLTRIFTPAGALLPDPLILGLTNAVSESLTNVISTVIVAALYVELREVKEGASSNQLADIFG